MVLRFTSKVEKYIKKCSHQQKLWQFLEVVYIALAGKLLLVNVWKSLELGEKPHHQATGIILKAESILMINMYNSSGAKRLFLG